ncbi:hypothetical protein GCM10020331_011190 [Ectobacillus funiculus]
MNQILLQLDRMDQREQERNRMMQEEKGSADANSGSPGKKGHGGIVFFGK